MDDISRGSLGIGTHTELHPLSFNCFILIIYVHQGNKSDKERKIIRKKLSFMHTKSFNTFFKR